MKSLLDELNEQPQALRDLAAAYAANSGWLDTGLAGTRKQILFTGMGASYHAAAIAALYLNACGLPAMAIEAADLLNYTHPAISSEALLIYISQSGESGEVAPLVERLGGRIPLIAVTNQSESTLARRARHILPLVAGAENWIASKTYINTLAVLWLLARQMSGGFDGSEYDTLHRLAGQVEGTLSASQDSSLRLIEAFGLDGPNGKTGPLTFLGHGPHALTARAAAMTMSEWTKTTHLHSSIAGFRHGFIEALQPGGGVIIFAPPGSPTTPSALQLAAELESYGGRVMLVEGGCLRLAQEQPGSARQVDEWLSPVLDIVPVQCLVNELAPRLGQGAGFRYIHKVVKKL